MTARPKPKLLQLDRLNNTTTLDPDALRKALNPTDHVWRDRSDFRDQCSPLPVRSDVGTMLLPVARVSLNFVILADLINCVRQ